MTVLHLRLLIQCAILSIATVAGFDYCTTEASVSNWGIDLGTIDMSNESTLEFYTVGDFGVVGCSNADCVNADAIDIANALGDYASESSNNGKFVINGGDNFYQNGISIYTPYNNSNGSLSRWNITFEDLYSSNSLQELYFYSVLGNHDWDPNERNAYDYNLSYSEWDIGTRTQIEYTSNTTLNKKKRWCMPSYYYTFSYQLKSFNVKFISFDSITLLPYDEDGCVPNENGTTNNYCKGPNIPTNQDQLIWLENLLNTSYNEYDYIVAFSHYFLVSAGKYGVITNGTRVFGGVTKTLDAKCHTRGNYGGFSMFSHNITRLFKKYNVQLYISGHEHNTEMFIGDYNNSNDDDGNNGQIMSILTGSNGKSDGILCATQTDIDEQYNTISNDVNWELKYNEVHTGFGHVTISYDNITAKLINPSLTVVMSDSIARIDRHDDSCGPEKIVNNIMFCWIFLVVAYH